MDYPLNCPVYFPCNITIKSPLLIGSQWCMSHLSPQKRQGLVIKWLLKSSQKTTSSDERLGSGANKGAPNAMAENQSAYHRSRSKDRTLRFVQKAPQQPKQNAPHQAHQLIAITHINHHQINKKNCSFSQWIGLREKS